MQAGGSYPTDPAGPWILLTFVSRQLLAGIRCPVCSRASRRRGQATLQVAPSAELWFLAVLHASGGPRGNMPLLGLSVHRCSSCEHGLQFAWPCPAMPCLSPRSLTRPARLFNQLQPYALQSPAALKGLQQCHPQWRFLSLDCDAIIASTSIVSISWMLMQVAEVCSRLSTGG